MGSFTSRALILLCFGLFASTGEAAPKKAQFTGTISSGYDEGLFGAPGSLDGLTAVLTFIFDNNQNGVNSHTDYVTYVESEGTGGFDDPLPMYATLQINGITKTNYTSSYYLQILNNPGYDTVFYTLGGGALASAYIGDFNIVDSVHLIDEQHYKVSPSAFTSGSFNFGSWDNDDRAYGLMTFDKLFLGPAVPEPATWVMMILGFGVIGLALRQRRNIRQVELDRETIADLMLFRLGRDRRSCVIFRSGGQSRTAGSPEG